ncbi:MULTISPECIES: FAD-dependent oxidoreductase [unclassified Clostridium]|uniref:FAD-dependent oxidoreductase n=1 Tax=unclassified Clostridium TaxID=2614128 RepID=UPI000EE2583E|nr:MULTISPECIES: FAD-dependent oxidoreductase [unclassified Clostridium]HCQ90160.1 pyridine nucleotide-disulfide oxidoreductase [Clostridium sp.]
MKILVIGGVAAGTKTAAKLKREDKNYDVTLITRDKHISYAGCGLPYYIGGVIEDKKDLIVKTPEEFEKFTGVQVFTQLEAKEISKNSKEVEVQDLSSGEIKKLNYDKLVIATGASPFVPAMEGKDLEGVFTIRTPEDAVKIREAVEQGDVKRAVVIGGGFIGIEVAENLIEQGVKVTLIEMAPQILPGFDIEIAHIAQEHLLDKGIMPLMEEQVISIEGANRVEKVITDKRKIKADMVVMAIGVRANTEIAQRAGITLGERNAIRVNEYMETSEKDIYAVGDCAENINIITESKVWYPMGSTSNKMGRIAALNISGERAALDGVLGTTVVKIFDINTGKTGLSEQDAKSSGFNTISILVPTNDRAHYYPGAKNIVTKLIADKDSRRILGAQIIGPGVIDKPIDILATAITFKAKVEDIENLDLAYAPPFSMAMASTIVAANVLLNKMNGKVDTVTPIEFRQDKDKYRVIDLRSEDEFEEKHIEGAINIPFDNINEHINHIEKNENLILVCRVGKIAYIAYKKLKALGYKDIKILEGGMTIPQI